MIRGLARCPWNKGSYRDREIKKYAQPSSSRCALGNTTCAQVNLPQSSAWCCRCARCICAAVLVTSRPATNSGMEHETHALRLRGSLAQTRASAGAVASYPLFCSASLHELSCWSERGRYPCPVLPVNSESGLIATTSVNYSTSDTAHSLPIQSPSRSSFALSFSLFTRPALLVLSRRLTPPSKRVRVSTFLRIFRHAQLTDDPVLNPTDCVRQPKLQRRRKRGGQDASIQWPCQRPKGLPNGW